jgi:hypothetical protein
MRTLLLSAPKDKDEASLLHRTFDSILKSGVGPDYAVYGNLIGQTIPGMKVILFERVDCRQAEGFVDAVTPTGHKTGGGVSRYNVVIRDLHPVPYTHPPSVNRCGVGLA